MSGRTGRRLIHLAFIAALAGCNPFSSSPPPFQGYVEGSYVSVAAEEGGRLTELAVRRGQKVNAGDLLFRLADAEQRAAVAEAAARVAQAEAQLANLKSGKRPEEIAVLEAQVAQARAGLTAAEADFSRASQLFASRVVAQAQVDAARERRDGAAAVLAAAERQIEAARLPARPEEIAAAERNLAALRAGLSAAEVRLARRTAAAPSAAMVDDVYFDAGEFAAAAQPVVSLLPDSGRKIRFFLPEPRLAELKPGDRVAVGCDGCPPNLRAEVTFIASQPEYTPPVIYSRENRAKLVFRVEARPLDTQSPLTVGLPVDVRLIAGERIAARP